MVLQTASDVQTGESTTAAVSWPAVIAGGVASAAIGLVLLALGAGIGFAVAPPWPAPASTTFHVGTGLYFIVMAMISSSIGGYLAGRLRHRWMGTHVREVYFRDTAHGFLAWALATLLNAAVLTSAAGALLAATGGIARVATQAPTPVDSAVDVLLRTDPATEAARSADAAGNAALRGEVARIFATTLQGRGDFAASDRSYLVQVVTAHAGISGADANARVAQVIDATRASVKQAQRAAAKLSLWLTAALLLGAFCSSLAATEGGGLRDGTWKYQV